MAKDVQRRFIGISVVWEVCEVKWMNVFKKLRLVGFIWLLIGEEIFELTQLHVACHMSFVEFFGIVRSSGRSMPGMKYRSQKVSTSVMCIDQFASYEPSILRLLYCWYNTFSTLLLCHYESLFSYLISVAADIVVAELYCCKPSKKWWTGSWAAHYCRSRLINSNVRVGLEDCK